MAAAVRLVLDGGLCLGWWAYKSWEYLEDLWDLFSDKECWIVFFIFYFYVKNFIQECRRARTRRFSCENLEEPKPSYATIILY